MTKTFVGFGFGPIQSGLFLYEAFLSGNFSRFVVAEIDEDLINAVRSNSGCYTINIARKNRIDKFELHGIEIYNPQQSVDHAKLIDAITISDEIATALPSVNFYDTGAQTSVAQLISAGLTRRRTPLPTIIYAAENHNQAAGILTEQLQANTPLKQLKEVQVLNTVIGKMSGIISDADTVGKMNLTPITPNATRSILVEEFNKILISRIALPNFKRGIEVFVEKNDLLPFEEAKLYGHNAIHALIGYLAEMKGYKTIAEAGKDVQIMTIAHQAFIKESGGALIRRNNKTGDKLFTPAGYREFAEDLLDRMINPNLHDLVARVTRDHERKLGYNDRLFGTMRIALQNDIEPRNLALGAAAGIISLIKYQDKSTTPIPNLPKTIDELKHEEIEQILRALWGSKSDEKADVLISLTCFAFSSTDFADLKSKGK